VIHLPQGGRREGAGRKPKGIRNIITLTLPQEAWDNIERDAQKDGSKAATIRRIVCNTTYLKKIVKED
jgi:hypothetical protein